jgi:uridine kinase
VRVAVDGVDGSGKTWFADDLAVALRGAGRDVVRVSADGFHQARELRHRRGRDSPEGFFLDSYDLPRLRAEVLGPLGPGGDRRYREAVYDVRRERALSLPWRAAPRGSVLLLDGLFLHRADLRDAWDLTVFLDVPFAVTFARMAVRDGCDPDPSAAANRRYVEGQRRYLAEVRPVERADVVVDATDPRRPRRVR